MAREKKADKEKREDITLLHDLLELYYPEYNDSEYLAEDLGYDKCTACEKLSLRLSMCQVCDELFCTDCGPEHATEETGF